jgi:LysM repeat protein
VVIHRNVLLAAIALSVSLLSLGVQGPTPTPTPTPTLPTPVPTPVPTRQSQLPPTQPGLTSDEGVFLVTAGDDGSKLVYFIAQNTRHSTLTADLQLEQQLNPLWPVRTASREEVLDFPEATPVGSARSGLLSVQAAVEPSSTQDTAMAEPSPTQDTAMAEPNPATEPQPTATDTAVPAVADAAPTLADDLPIVADADAVPVVAAATVDHTLKAGENLIRLSAQNGTTVRAILNANGISNANRVYIGQTIHIPTQTVSPAVADQLVQADQPTGVDQAVPTQPAATEQLAVVEANESDRAAPVAALAEPVADVPADAEPVTYVVKKGDTAMSVSRKYRIDVEALLDTNTVANRNHIEAGQILIIPG